MNANDVREKVKDFVEGLGPKGVSVDLVVQMTTAIQVFQNQQYKKMRAIMRQLMDRDLLAGETEYDQDMRNELVNQLWAAVNNILGDNGWISCDWEMPKEHETKDGEFDPSDPVLVLLDDGFNKNQKISRYWNHRRSESKEFLKWLDLNSWEQNRVIGWQPLPGNEMFSAFESKPFTPDDLKDVSMDNIKNRVDMSVENAAVQAELREYRKLGSVEHIKYVIETSTVSKSMRDELQQYREIGSIEEIQSALKELKKLKYDNQFGSILEVLNFAAQPVFASESIEDLSALHMELVQKNAKIYAYEQFGTPEEVQAAVQFMKLAKKYGTVGRVVEACMEYEEIGDVEEFRKLKETKKELQKYTQPISFIDHMIAVFDTAKPGDKIDFFEELEKFMGLK